MKLTLSRRIKKTPFSERLIHYGVNNFTVYNRTLLPTIIHSLEEDYFHLKSAVQVWDVSCQTQLEIKGNDAKLFVQMITPRDIGSTPDQKCMYIPVVNKNGKMINDPILIKLSESIYRLSTSDSDIILWLSGILEKFKLDVTLTEKNIYTLAVQGPKSEYLMNKIFGSSVQNLKFFNSDYFNYKNCNYLISRTGFSKQNGYEIYIEEEKLCLSLWDSLLNEGKNLDVRPGCPNLIERIEGGLLSYGNDMNRENSPLECGLGKFCSYNKQLNFLGIDALIKEKNEGVAKIIKSISIHGLNLPFCSEPWPIKYNEKIVGSITSSAYSPIFETNVSLGMVDSKFLNESLNLKVEIQSKNFDIDIRDKPFI
tara:strand:+ start:2689 stop:3789 length:1101 start_codon:yes stop_codon:yes gene_type:complete